MTVRISINNQKAEVLDIFYTSPLGLAVFLYKEDYLISFKCLSFGLKLIAAVVSWKVGIP